jgi:hypothetical protein
MNEVTGPSLRADRYGIYLWTPRFVVHLMWPFRFWAVSRSSTPKYHGGSVHFGPIYFAWYDRAAWED